MRGDCRIAITERGGTPYRIAVMKDRYIVQVGTPEELVTQPANDYIQAFTQDVNIAQVIKTGNITRRTLSLTPDRDSSNTAP